MNRKKVFLNIAFGLSILFLLFLNYLANIQNSLWFDEQRELALANYYYENNEKDLYYQIYDKYKEESRYSLSAEFNLVYAKRYKDDDKELASEYVLRALNAHPYLILQEDFKREYYGLINLNFVNGVENEEKKK